MLGVIQSFGEHLPAACQNTHQEAWAVFEPFLVKYGSEYSICERTTRVLRLGLTFFGPATLPILPSVLARMASCFEATGFSSYLWMAGKIIGRFGNEEDPTLRSAFQDIFERASNKLVLMLQEKPAEMMPDGEHEAVNRFQGILIDQQYSPRRLLADASADDRLRARRLLPFTCLPHRIPRGNGRANARTL